MKGLNRMKYITVAVPCYNSAPYMRHCIDTLLCAGDDIEIIIINDGSTDDTGAIADEYASKNPGTVRVIHQENSGHGEGVNQGVVNAKGLYFKVVDSDDWVNSNDFNRLLSKIKEHYAYDTLPDMYVCNYVYEHASDKSTYIMKYSNVFKKNTISSWDESKRFRPSQCLMMHSVFFRTEFLQKDYVPLPKHTFFVDNLFMFRPLPRVKSLYYMDIDLYRYFIGRDDQSVNENMMIKRIDQQIYVSGLMFESHKLEKIRKECKPLYRYMLHNIAIMMLINASFSFLSGDSEKIRNYYNIWKELKKSDSFLYKKLKYQSVAAFTLLPGKAGRSIFVCGYRIMKKLVKFG